MKIEENPPKILRNSRRFLTLQKFLLTSVYLAILVTLECSLWPAIAMSFEDSDDDFDPRPRLFDPGPPKDVCHVAFLRPGALEDDGYLTRVIVPLPGHTPKFNLNAFAIEIDCEICAPKLVAERNREMTAFLKHANEMMEELASSPDEAGNVVLLNKTGTDDDTDAKTDGGVCVENSAESPEDLDSRDQGAAKKS